MLIYSTISKYAGIGSRQTPPKILGLMTKIAKTLAPEYLLQTGGAKGADTAFLRGCQLTKYDYFNFQATHYKCRWLGTTYHKPYKPKHWVLAEKVAAEHHPAWAKLGAYTKKLMTRNAFIVLGGNVVSPVNFVVCWTPEGKIIGGTGHSLRLAQAFNIPVYNIGAGLHIISKLEADLKINLTELKW